MGKIRTSKSKGRKSTEEHSKKKIITDKQKIRDKKIENMKLKKEVYQTAKGWGKGKIQDTAEALLKKENSKISKEGQNVEEVFRKRKILKEAAKEARKADKEELEKKIEQIDKKIEKIQKK